MKNKSYQRKLCIVSVDGINVITGKEAVVAPEDGYIVDGYNTLKIDGWRISDFQVKEFLFTYNKNKSYAVKLGAKDNLGVIGFAFYSELQSIANTTVYLSASCITDDYWTSQCSVTTNCCVTTDDFKASTAKGKAVDSRVADAKFNTEALQCTDQIYYDTRENLIKRGIIVVEKSLPKPFKNSQYCPDV